MKKITNDYKYIIEDLKQSVRRLIVNYSDGFSKNYIENLIFRSHSCVDYIKINKNKTKFKVKGLQGYINITHENI
jgi:hypothetical protein